MSALVAIRRQRESGFRLRAGITPLLAAVIVACAPQPEPRTVLDFMEDGLARDGVLTRCNQNRDETLTDEECANARRAAAALALEAERARAPELERESEAKLLAMRDREARRAAASRMRPRQLAPPPKRLTRLAGGAPGSPRAADGDGAPAAAPAFGAPVGTVMPSMTSRRRSTSTPTAPTRSVGVASRSRQPSRRRTTSCIQSPELELADLAIVPRPFRDDVDRPALTPRLAPRLTPEETSLLLRCSAKAGLPFGATADGAPGSTAAVRNASRNGSAAAGVSNRLCAERHAARVAVERGARLLVDVESSAFERRAGEQAARVHVDVHLGAARDRGLRATAHRTGDGRRVAAERELAAARCCAPRDRSRTRARRRRSPRRTARRSCRPSVSRTPDCSTRRSASGSRCTPRPRRPPKNEAAADQVRDHGDSARALEDIRRDAVLLVGREQLEHLGGVDELVGVVALCRRRVRAAARRERRAKPAAQSERIECDAWCSRGPRPRAS